MDPLNSSEMSFLEVDEESHMDAMELADTRELFQVMGRVRDHVEDKAYMSNRCIWQLVIRPLLNIFKTWLKRKMAEFFRNMIKSFLTELIGQILSMMTAVKANMALPDIPSGEDLVAMSFLELHLNSYASSKTGIIIDPILSMISPVLISGLHSSIMNRCGPLLERSLKTALTDSLQKELHLSVTRSVSRQLILDLSYELSVSLTQAVVDKLCSIILKNAGSKIERTFVMSITPPLVQTLAFSLQRNPIEDYFCFYCSKDGKTFCDECTRSLLSDYERLYYASVYSEYYGDYYGDQYSQLVKLKAVESRI